MYTKTKPPIYLDIFQLHMHTTHTRRILESYLRQLTKKNSTLELEDRSSVGRSQREIVFAIRKELKNLTQQHP